MIMSNFISLVGGFCGGVKHGETTGQRSLSYNALRYIILYSYVYIHVGCTSYLYFELFRSMYQPTMTFPSSLLYNYTQTEIELFDGMS